MILSSASMRRGQGKKRTDSKRRKKNKADAPPDDKFSASTEELLPGIPNHVTLACIIAAMKIERPLTTLPILSTVSPAWRQAMQDGLVHAARVDHQSAQTFIVLKLLHAHGNATFGLLSLKRRNFHHLPPIPQVDGGIPFGSRCVGVAGKIYILGGAKGDLGSKEVYMWDLAGQGQWTQRAQMREGRQEFGCGVLNGKIYAFGGTSPNERVVRGSEVYDPNSNVWSRIKRIPNGWNQFDHTVTVVGDELYLYGGKSYDFYIRGGVRHDNGLSPAYGLKAYHPLQKRWRLVISSNKWRQSLVRKLPWGLGASCGFFVAQGRVLYISLSTIYVYDSDSEVWTELHSFSFAAIRNSYSIRRQPNTVLCVEKVVHVDDELLALVSGSPKHLVLRSKGFNRGGRRIAWEDISPLLTDFSPEISICTLQL